MDRVLLLYEDNAEANHLQNTLRKVGFDVESIANDYSLSEKLLSFNPDIMLVYGKGNKFTTVQVGKKLKESFRFIGKVVLVFPKTQMPQPQDILEIRIDVLIQAPTGALKVAAAVLKLSGRDSEAILDKLLRIAETDASFRSAENKFLAAAGMTIDSELLIVKGAKQGDGINFAPSGKSMDASMPAFTTTSPEPAGVIIDNTKIHQQIVEAKEQSAFRTASYKQFIDKVVADPKANFAKKAARKKQKELLKDWDPKELKEQDDLRKEFANALGKSGPKK